MAKRRTTDDDGDFELSSKKISTKKMKISDQKTPTKRTQPTRSVTKVNKLSIGEQINPEEEAELPKETRKDKPVPNEAASAENRAKALNKTIGLMKLAPELRHDIYGMVFPKSAVRIYSFEHFAGALDLDKKRKLCRQTCSVYGIRQGVYLPDLYSWDWDLFRGGHAECEDESDEGRETIEKTLSLLAVCRDIYNESSLILYQQSIFAFDKLLNLEAFAPQAPYEQLNAMRDMAVVLEPFNVDDTFGPLLRQTFSRLRTLSIIADTSGNGSGTLREIHFRDPSEEEHRIFLNLCAA